MVSVNAAMMTVLLATNVVKKFLYSALFVVVAVVAVVVVVAAFVVVAVDLRCVGFEFLYDFRVIFLMRFFYLSSFFGFLSLLFLIFWRGKLHGFRYFGMSRMFCVLCVIVRYVAVYKYNM